ncbi:MAG TPA: nuclear transport factor 2 family protein [Polyangia bacterium]|nr:nuclear transport factor 2 family protein [Polyangia bacterium]
MAVALVTASSNGGDARASPSQDAAIAEIAAVLSKQVASWNAKDLEGYMRGYWNSPDLTFYSNATITKGWAATLARYRQRYQGDGREMGTLAFQETTTELLGSEGAVVHGRWRLKFAHGDERSGLFTVVFRHFPAGWLIIHDHSSAD